MRMGFRCAPPPAIQVAPLRGGFSSCAVPRRLVGEHKGDILFCLPRGPLFPLDVRRIRVYTSRCKAVSLWTCSGEDRSWTSQWLDATSLRLPEFFPKCRRHNSLSCNYLRIPPTEFFPLLQMFRRTTAAVAQFDLLAAERLRCSPISAMQLHSTRKTEKRKKSDSLRPGSRCGQETLARFEILRFCYQEHGEQVRRPRSGESISVAFGMYSSRSA
jgi:hypothetical protein